MGAVAVQAVRLAIVGSTQFARDSDATKRASKIIARAICVLDPEQIISGGAEGIDSLAAAFAEVNGIPLREHLPKNRRWKPDGFQDRNYLIAQDCTHLLCIRHHASKTYGSGWTADEAERLGKAVERHEIGPR